MAHVNIVGHPDQLRRHYGLLSICGVALTVDNAWVALGGSIAVSINNGGPPGVLYELLVACLYYAVVAASIAELASSLPTSGGVYHWASRTAGPKYGRITGFYAGILNVTGWLFDLASIVYIAASVVVQLYALYRPELIVKPWHIYITYVLLTWSCAAVIIFANKLLPLLNLVGLVLVSAGGLISVVVLVAMPSQRATRARVWSLDSFRANNVTGWNDGVAFILGILNGAFAIGTPDSVSHLAEESLDPSRDLPRAIATQIILGTLTSFGFAIALFYGVQDFSIISSDDAFPLAALYLQATGSEAAACGLLVIVFLAIFICILGTYLTVGRMLWALARDNALPYSMLLGQVNQRLSCPVFSTIFCALLCTALGAVQLASKTAFTDLVGGFVALTTTSYAIAIIPHVANGRSQVPRGHFWLGAAGYTINILAGFLIIFFNIMFCFPYGLPVNALSMSYNSVILTSSLILITLWWLLGVKANYSQPTMIDCTDSRLTIDTKVA